MQVTDFTTQDGRSSLQNVRRLIARAVSESIGVAAKVTWLSAVFAGVTTDVTAGVSWSRPAADSDKLSNNSRPDLVAALTKAVSESSTYGGDYKTQLLQDIVDADAILTA